MASKKKINHQGARAAKGLRSGAARRLSARGAQEERIVTAWDQAREARREEALRSPEHSDEDYFWPASERMMEALGESLADLCERSREAHRELDRVAIGAAGAQDAKTEAAIEAALEKRRLIHRALERVAREGAAEGLLDQARERLLLEMGEGIGAPFESVAREMARGALERLGAQDMREWGEEGAPRALPGSARALGRWVKDEAFWEAVEKETTAERELTMTESRWAYAGQRGDTLAWADALVKLAGVMIREPEAREAGEGLWERLAGAMDKAQLEASWEDLGQEGGILAMAGELDEQGVKEAMRETPGAYWMGLRSALLERSSGSEGGDRLAGLILGNMIESAGQSEEARGLLGEHLWGILDTEGLAVWALKDARAPLEVIPGLDLPWESSTFMLSLSMKSEGIAWAAPAFAAAGLGPEQGKRSSAWFDGGLEARAKAAFEGVHALMESRELKASVEKGRAPARRAGL